MESHLLIVDVSACFVHNVFSYANAFKVIPHFLSISFSITFLKKNFNYFVLFHYLIMILVAEGVSSLLNSKL